MSYRLVTFDVTNTLLKFRTSPGQQYAKVAHLYGVKADADKLSRTFKREWKELNVELPNFGANANNNTCKSMTSTEWWKVLVSRTFLSAGYPLDSQSLTAISSHLIKMYRTSACWDNRPGAREVLHSLKQKQGLSLGVISNFDDSLHSVLSNTGLLPFFDFVVASYNAGCYKPNSEIFQVALQHAKCMPNEAVHIGDDWQLDYLGARKAGWDALLLLADNLELSDEMAVDAVDLTRVINDLRDVVFKIDNAQLL